MKLVACTLATMVLAGCAGQAREIAQEVIEEGREVTDLALDGGLLAACASATEGSWARKIEGDVDKAQLKANFCNTFYFADQPGQDANDTVVED